MTVPAPALALQNLRVALGGREVLHAVSCRFPAGALSILVGPNGAGKSTLLRAVAGLNPLAAGQVLAGDTDLLALPLRERARRLAWVPDRSEIAFHFTVLEAVVMGRYAHHQGAATATDRAAAHAALAQLGIETFAGRQVHALSSGERQKVMIARALAGATPYLLLDEPCAALDIGASLALMHLLHELAAGGRTIVMTLHDLGLAHRYADYAACLEGGCLRASGAPAAVFTPAVLDPVFGVKTRLIDEGASRPGLRFD